MAPDIDNGSSEGSIGNGAPHFTGSSNKHVKGKIARLRQ